MSEACGGDAARRAEVERLLKNLASPHQAVLEKSINAFMVMNELEGGLSHHSLITDEELKKEYKELLAVVREEYEDILKAEVQRAISADEDAIKRLAANYIENVRAYTQLPILSSIPLLENDLLVRRKRRLSYVGWSAAVILGIVAMSGSMYYHYFMTS